NKSKGVLITGLKLKAFRNPQPSWGFSIDKKATRRRLVVNPILRVMLHHSAHELSLSFASQ
ncbi:hypothetical protein, partial [Salmonella enterica]